MNFLTNLLVYGLAFVGLILVVATLITAAVLSFQEHFGYLVRDSAVDRAFSTTDRLHAEAQRAVRDLEDLANRGDR